MAEQKQLYYITVTSPELKTIRDFTRDLNSGAIQYTDKETEFLNVTDEWGITNRDRLKTFYSTYESNLYSGYSDADLPLRIGVRFAIPMDMVDRNGLLTQGLQIVDNSDVAFKASALAKIEADKGYVQVIKPVDGQIKSGTVKQMVPQCTVWLWCRSLSGKYDEGEMKGQIFDISPFVQTLNTNVSKQGGSFTITLTPIVCEQNTDGIWVVREGSMMQYQNPEGTDISGMGYVAEASIYDNNLNRNQFLFHNIVNTNDLIFIRFETLELEKGTRFNNDDGKLYISKNQLANKIYDMIGLIDIGSSTLNPSNNDGRIVIAGRDLSKLFIEDGCYVFPAEQMTDGKMGLAGSASNKNGLRQRIISDGQLLYFNLWYNTSIEKAFAFIMNQLVNTKIVPDDLFSGYDESKKNRLFKLQDNDAFKGKPRQVLLEEYKSDAIKAIKQLRSLNGTADSLASKETDSSINLFEDVKNFLSAIRNKNARQVDGNTTIGWNAFTWNRPDGKSEEIDVKIFPLYFDQKLYKQENLLPNGVVPHSDVYQDIINNIDSYLDLEGSTGNFKERYSEELAPGIWQIMKLVIDKGVTNRRLVDASLSVASGSIVNYFRKICQEPFVEYMSDTYGDTFNMIVRKPPTDQIGLISLLEGKVETEDGRIIAGNSPIIDIEDYDVIHEDLCFDDRDVYSWYHLNPKFNLSGDSSFTYSYLPGLLFDEYAQVWGARSCDITSNYMPYIPLDPKSKESDLDLSQKQAIYDLKYLVDSNMANPFMRKGTLTVNGDRRIKSGNLIRYKATGEIFRVDAVNQDAKFGEEIIDRTTVLHVSRGMVEQLIYGIPYWNSQNQELDHLSYFNIINTDLNLKYTTSPITTTKQIPDGFEEIKSTNIISNKKFPEGSITSILQSSFITSSDGLVHNRGLDKLKLLQPEQQKIFIQFINAINNLTFQGASILVEITDTVRTKEQQQIQYSKNKLNAKPGKSAHEASNGGLAIDLNLMIRINKRYSQLQYIGKSDSRAMWISTGVPQLAKDLGLLWGGDSIPGYYDPVHFQIVPQTTAVTRKPKYKNVTKTINQTTLDESAIFSNFRVNKHVFDFFLRKEQFAQKYNVEQVNRTIFKKEVRKAFA